MRVRCRKNLESHRQQRVAGEDRRPLVIFLVHRWPATAHVIVVHGREVVVHERIAMDAFDRRGSVHRLRRRDAEQGRALKHQEGAEALAAGQQCVAHGRAEACPVARAVGAEQRGEALLHEAGRVTKPLRNPH